MWGALSQEAGRSRLLSSQCVRGAGDLEDRVLPSEALGLGSQGWALLEGGQTSKGGSSGSQRVRQASNVEPGLCT